MINPRKNIGFQLWALSTRYLISILLLNTSNIFCQFVGIVILAFSLRDILFLYGGSEKFVFPFEIISIALVMSYTIKSLPNLKGASTIEVLIAFTITMISVTLMLIMFINKSMKFIEEMVDKDDR